MEVLNPSAPASLGTLEGRAAPASLWALPQRRGEGERARMLTLHVTDVRWTGAPSTREVLDY